jgi:hypothetical protein
MDALDNQLEAVNAVNVSEIRMMDRLVATADAGNPESSTKLHHSVQGIQAAILHSFKIQGHLSLQTEDPTEAANLWQSYIEFCDDALRALKAAKDKFQNEAAREVYDLALDYRNEASQRRQQNLHAAECQKITVPKGLFPAMN